MLASAVESSNCEMLDEFWTDQLNQPDGPLAPPLHHSCVVLTLKMTNVVGEFLVLLQNPISRATVQAILTTREQNHPLLVFPKIGSEQSMSQELNRFQQTNRKKSQQIIEGVRLQYQSCT